MNKGRQLWAYRPNFPLSFSCKFANNQIKIWGLCVKGNFVSLPSWSLWHSHLSVQGGVALSEAAYWKLQYCLSLILRPSCLNYMTSWIAAHSSLTAFLPHRDVTGVGSAPPAHPKCFLYCDLNFRESSGRVAVHQSDPMLALLRGGEQALQSYPAWQVGSVLITNRLT